MSPRGPQPRSAVERFCEKVDFSGECWLWTASTHKQGYGTFRVHSGGKIVKAHRFAYELWVGEIPEGAQINHRCDNTACVRPEHLYAGTQTDNMQDMMRRGRHPQCVPRTHCPQGHEFTEENTYVDRRGFRQCRECGRERMRRRRAELKAVR